MVPAIEDFDDIGWTKIRDQVGLSLAHWLLIIIVCYGMRGPWVRHRWYRSRFVTLWIGQDGTPPKRPHLDAILRFAQGFSSFWTCSFWIGKTYYQRVPVWIYLLDVGFCIVFYVHLIFSLMYGGFGRDVALSWETGLDAFTVTPLICERISPFDSWLSFAYLRCLRVLTVRISSNCSGICCTHIVVSRPSFVS